MSSPEGNGGPPPDPPLSPQQPQQPPQQSSDDQAQSPPNTAANESAGGSASGSGSAAVPDGQAENNAQRRTPLSSMSFFLPFPMNPTRPAEGGAAEGGEDRFGMTWTVEVFPNDGEGANEAEDAPQNPGPGTDGMPPFNIFPPAPPTPAGDNAEPTVPVDPPVGEQREPTPAPGAPQGEGQRHERTIYWFIGPDGQAMRPGGAGGPGAGGIPIPNFAFPFVLPFAFGQSGPPAPDPAKAAELLASLPTVGRALLRRVDKIITAEDTAGGKEYDDRGWRCGICLEGMEEDAKEPASAHPVKALPCNHLFHEECLQPWFTSHHTCPTCRLALDPLRTLHGPREQRGNPLRPAATGSGRATPRTAPHPYARERETRGPPSGAETPVNPTENPTQAQNRDGQGFNPPPPLPGGASGLGAPNGVGGVAGGYMAALTESLTNAVAQAAARLMGELGPQPRVFNNPMTASPAPMDRSASAPAGTTAAQPVPQPPATEGEQDPQAGAPAAGVGSPPRPTPERRPHIHIIRVPPRSPRPGDDAAAGAVLATAEGPEREGTAAANAAPDVSGTPGDRPDQNDTPHEDTPGGRPGVTVFPPFEFIFLRPPQAAEAAPAEPVPEAAPFVPQSLGSWTEQREKTLGWRCDAVECLVAPPVPDEGEEMDVDEEDDTTLAAGDKEMVSIYAPTQGVFDTSEGEGPDAKFVILACKHRWHRSCLETAERSAGHRATPDADGREWVRCQRCRKEGWITPRAEPEVPDVPTVAAAA